MANEKILELPDFLAKYRTNKETVCIDIEIAPAIEHLWDHKIETLSCCSGHGKNPGLVIAEHYKDEDITRIKKLISEVDSSTWEIFQWRLIKF